MGVAFVRVSSGKRGDLSSTDTHNNREKSDDGKGSENEIKPIHPFSVDGL